METTNKKIFNGLVDYLKEYIKTDVSKDIIIYKLDSYSSKVETDKLKEVIELYFRLKYNINSLKGNDDLNVQTFFEGNKREALRTLDCLREQYNITDIIKETITVTQTNDEYAKIEVYCNKDFFVSSIIELINIGKDRGIIGTDDLNCIFNATK